MATSGPVLGIDLGTTFSAVAVVGPRGPVLLPNREGHRLTPSVLHFRDADDCAVGDAAQKMVLIDPANVARFFKRSMGEEGFSLEFFGRPYTPQELSAILLRKLVADAALRLGRTPRRAVISVPAYFDAAQRRATQEAGALAGLEVLSLINEPTAAALAYGVGRGGRGSGNVMVFDLGGGTFDVTLLRIEGPDIRILGSDGNAELGGKDWDDRLVNALADAFARRFGQDPRDDPQAFQLLYERSLAAKLVLSREQRTSVQVSYGGHRVRMTVTREQFEAVTRDLVEQCAETCELVLEQVGLDWEQVDLVVPVGGSTRMPMILEMLRSRARRVERAVHPDEAVALGAALAAHYRHGASPIPARKSPPRGARPEGPLLGAPEPFVLPELHFTDVNTHPLGVLVLDSRGREHVVELIPAGTPLPATRKGRFAYARSGTTSVQVDVTEGRGRSRDEVRVVGSLVLDRLPPRPRGTPIEVIYHYSADQVLRVDVVDVSTGIRRAATLRLRGALGSAAKRAREGISRISIR